MTTRATPTTRGRSTRRAIARPSRDYSRAYLHHLVKAGEALGAMLLTWNNLCYYQSLMAGVRAAIAAGSYADYAGRMQNGVALGGSLRARPPSSRRYATRARSAGRHDRANRHASSSGMGLAKR